MPVFDSLSDELKAVLATPISKLGLKLAGSPVEPFVEQMYHELADKGLAKFHPVVYLSDEWGCPSGEPVIGVPFYLGDKPGSAQTMKLVNNLLAATGLIATCEAVAMGVKAGLDAAVMIDVLNAGSGATHASRDKFPRSILPRSFDYGFATGLMVKDVRLYLDEAKTLGVSMEVADAVARLWEAVMGELGPESDFTAAIKPIERAAGVVVGGPRD